MDINSMTDVLEALANYRAPEADIDWRVGTKKRDGSSATAFAYMDTRKYEAILNEIVGAARWNMELKPWSENKVICSVTITVGPDSVIRSSSGQKSVGNGGSDNEGPTAEAQAEKRACAKFGLMSYLYEFPFKYYKLAEGGFKFAEQPQVPTKFLPEKKARVLNDKEVANVKDDLRKAGVTTQSALTRAMQEALGRMDWNDWEGITNTECNKLLDYVEER